MEWVCGECTFSNGADTTACEMCGSEKKQKTTATSALAPEISRETASSQEAASTTKKTRRKRGRRELGGDDDDDDFDCRGKGSENEVAIIDESDDEARLNKLVGQMTKLNKKSYVSFY
jgi:hypothetical protein